MRKYYLEQDEINAFVQVLQLPHVLPIQGPYAIKLLKALAEATKSKYGDSKALNEAAETLTNSYESFVSKLCSLLLDSTKTDVPVKSNTSSFSSPLTGAVKDSAPIQPLIFSMKRIFVKIIKNFVETTDNSDQTLVNELTDHLLALFAQKKVDLGTATVSRLYSDAIFAYLKDTFQPSAVSPDDDTETSTKECPIPDHLKAPLPIEHELIKNERPLSDDGKSVLPFPTPETAQAAYDRAVTIGCVLRSALHDVSAVSGTQTTLINNETLTTAASTAFSLLCRAALRAKPDSDRVNGYKWDPVLASVRGFDFKDEYRFYRKCWSVETDLTSDLQLECTNRHGAGVKAFLAPALHMLGCSQVTAVGNRAWPAVYHDKSCIDDQCNNHVIIFGRSTLLNHSGKVSSKQFYISTNGRAVAARPEIVNQPKVTSSNNTFDTSNIFELSMEELTYVFRGLQKCRPKLQVAIPHGIIPRSGAIYLSGMPKCDVSGTSLHSLSEFARSITNQSSFDEYTTLDWIIDVLRHQTKRSKLICNCPDWFNSMVEHPDQHFEPLPDCRAFRAFTGDHDYVPGYLGYKPVTIYYRLKDGKQSWRFDGQNEDFSNPGVLHVIHKGDWEHPDTKVTYKCYVTPYYLRISNHLAIPKGFAGPELAKRLLQVAGLERITIEELMMKYVLYKMPESFKTDPAVDALKTTANVETVSAFITVLKNNLTSDVSICASFNDKRPLVAAPGWCGKSDSVPRKPKRVIGSLAWALTGKYDTTWNSGNGWMKAAQAVLPKSLYLDAVDCPSMVIVFLKACIGSVCDTVEDCQPESLSYEDLSLQAVEHLKNSLMQNMTSNSKDQKTTTFSPSSAILWAHLVFCIMHRICEKDQASHMSELINHPFLNSTEERRSRLSYVCKYMYDWQKSNTMGHIIHQKLWPRDDLTDVFPAQPENLYDAFLDHARRYRFLGLMHCVPFIIVRHRFAHENPSSNLKRDNYPQNQIAQIYEGDDDQRPITFLRFFGRHFPALELAAWLMYAGEKVSVERQPLSGVAKVTLEGLGLSEKELKTAVDNAWNARKKILQLLSERYICGENEELDVTPRFMTNMMNETLSMYLSQQNTSIYDAARSVITKNEANVDENVEKVQKRRYNNN